jgi:hypothetical protein
MPDAQHTRSLAYEGRKYASSHHRHVDTIRRSCATVLRLTRVLLGVPGFLATVVRQSSSANLIPASGDQDHTISPSAPAALVSHGLCVHRIPPLTFVTIGRSAPPERAGYAEISIYFGKTEVIFWAKKLDRLI